jgi:hypothetical protein
MFTEFLSTLSNDEVAAIMWSLVEYDITLQDIEEYLQLRQQTQAESDLWNDLMIGSSDPLVGF